MEARDGAVDLRPAVRVPGPRTVLLILGVVWRCCDLSQLDHLDPVTKDRLKRVPQLAMFLDRLRESLILDP